MNIWTLAIGHLALMNFAFGVLEINFNLHDNMISMSGIVNGEVKNVSELSVQKLDNTKASWIDIGTSKEGQNATAYLDNYKITGGINSIQPSASSITVTFSLTELKEDETVVFQCRLSYKDKNNALKAETQNGTIFVLCKAADSTNAVDRCSLSTSVVVLVFILAFFTSKPILVTGW